MIPFEDFPTAVLSLVAALLVVNVWLEEPMCDRCALLARIEELEGKA